MGAQLGKGGWKKVKSDIPATNGDADSGRSELDRIVNGLYCRGLNDGDPDRYKPNDTELTRRQAKAALEALIASERREAEKKELAWHISNLSYASGYTDGKSRFIENELANAKSRLERLIKADRKDTDE